MSSAMPVERDSSKSVIPDEAFEKIFEFFDQWRLRIGGSRHTAILRDHNDDPDPDRGTRWVAVHLRAGTFNYHHSPGRQGKTGRLTYDQTGLLPVTSRHGRHHPIHGSAVDRLVSAVSRRIRRQSCLVVSQATGISMRQFSVLVDVLREDDLPRMSGLISL